MNNGRLLFIDACINPRVGTELRKRGRRSDAAKTRGWKDLDDDVLLPLAAKHYADEGVEWTLVTGDDMMPFDWPDLIVGLGITVATIDPRIPPNVEDDEWHRDTVHRWAHQMSAQPQGSIHRYSPKGHRAWTPRKTRN